MGANNFSEKEEEGKTFVIIKPGAVRRGATVGIVEILTENGLWVKKIKRVHSITKDHLLKHYNKDQDWFLKVGNKEIKFLIQKGECPTKTAEEYGRDALEKVIDHMLSGPFYIIILKGRNAVTVVQGLTGIIRAQFGIDVIDNAIHRSDLGKETEEIELWEPYLKKE